ncbi:Site-specific recombinase [Verrucomicrobium sp. GAS474]|uniref:hypothetical protein n=1 Tax=Verrucomicrobium sp. GAS474 TaxID=1882831 RepID=UPI00087A3B4C|nr:hypothetical protein [Verrucomicrobium sp. GAS474]SDT90303.1 Site-specific recombinase [Verrucomicrobium sp. GAS474]
MLPQILAVFSRHELHAADGLAFVKHFDTLAEAASLGDRLDAWLEIVDWVRDGGEQEWDRLEALLDLLESLPEVRLRLQTALARIFDETEGANLFAESGMPSARGLFPELWDRLVRVILPEPRDDHDLGRLLVRQFRDNAAPESFRRMDPALFHRFILLVFPIDHPSIDRGLRAAFADGFRLLAAKAQAHGLAADLRARSTEGPRPGGVADSPFYRLPAASEELVLRWSARRTGADIHRYAELWRKEAAACRQALATVNRRLETSGVSVEIVFGVAVIEQALGRMEIMADIMTSAPMTDSPDGPVRNPVHSHAIHVLFCDLASAARHDASVTLLVASSMSLLHRKIVERSGITGRHYVAENRAEYWSMWRAAAGGGALTTFTAALKMVITHLSLPLFVIGFLSGLNYAVSFVLLQTFNFVLATKQPAMTAAHLAEILRGHGEDREPARGRERERKRLQERNDAIAAFIARLVRTQIAAALGNILVVTVGAVAFSFLWLFCTGHTYLSQETADHVFHTLSPLNSGTLFYAALTGVILWLASLIGGWVDNFAVYHRLPQAIREHRLRDRLGRERLARWSVVFSENIGGWGTNISLGFLLGMTPVIGSFLGLPLDVRHVTLSTGQLALACSSLQHHWFHQGWFLLALSGIASMFVLNLGVSFLLSLFTAARAYGLRTGDIVALLVETGRRFVRHPREFLLPPPKGAGDSHGTSHGH